MHQPLVSIVMSTYQRAHLLKRSLECYECQQFDNRDMELVIIDDHSSDGTRELVLDWSKRTGIKSVVITASPKPGEWVDCGWILNLGIRASTGKNLLISHPEVMPGRKSVASCIEQLERLKWYYVCCRIYYLSPRDQERIDTVNWKVIGVPALREIEDFYDEDVGNPDFSHRATDIVAQPGSRLPHWESLVFGGFSRETWRKLGGLQHTEKWGSIDVALMMRRRALGIENYTCPGDDTICAHQNHDLPDDVKSPRVESIWKEELQDINFIDSSRLVYPYVNNLYWD